MKLQIAKMKLLLFGVFAIFFQNVYCQDCRTPGEECDDTKQCCGGCCKSGICTSTYDSCTLVDYPCDDDDYCPPGEECYMYKPSSACEGCGMQKSCRNAKNAKK